MQVTCNISSFNKWTNIVYYTFIVHNGVNKIQMMKNIFRSWDNVWSADTMEFFGHLNLPPPLSPLFTPISHLNLNLKNKKHVFKKDIRARELDLHTTDPPDYPPVLCLFLFFTPVIGCFLWMKTQWNINGKKSWSQLQKHHLLCV